DERERVARRVDRVPVHLGLDEALGAKDAGPAKVVGRVARVAADDRENEQGCCQRGGKCAVQHSQLSRLGPKPLCAQRRRVAVYCWRAQSTSSAGAAWSRADTLVPAGCQAENATNVDPASDVSQSSRRRASSTLREAAVSETAFGSGGKP